MADEIKIENIGGENGVASEVTLVRLVTAMEKMAKSSGTDPKSQAAKTQQAYNKAQQSGVKVSTKHRDAVKDNTSAVQSNTKYLNLAAGGLMRLASSGIGAAIGSLKGFATELLAGGDSLTSFAQHIPIFGSSISLLTGVLDKSFNSFQSVATSGADFGYSLSALRSTAADARLPLETFSSMVAQNSELLAGFGGNVTRGARQVAGMTDALGTDLTEELLKMGLSFEEINEQMSMSAYLNRSGSRTSTETTAQQAEAAAGLTKNLLILSKLTGEDIKSQQDKLAQATMDIAYQRKLAGLDKKQRDKMNSAMAEAQATGSSIAVNALKAEFLEMPPLTRELKLYHATQSENARLIKELLAEALDKGTDLTKFNEGKGERMFAMMDAALQAANSLDGVIAAGAVSMDGVAGELAGQFGVSAKLLTTYMEKAGNEITLNKKKFLEDVEAGKIKPEDPELGAMAQFLKAMGEAKKALTNNFVNPIVKTLTPALTEFTKWFTDFAGKEGDGSTFQTSLRGFSKYLDETVTPALEGFFETIKDKGLAVALEEALFGDGKEKKGLVSSVFKPIGVALADGIKDGFKAIFSDPIVIAGTVAAIGLLFAGPAIAGAIAGRIAAGALAAAATTSGGAPIADGKANPKGKMSFSKAALKKLGPLALLFGAYEIGSTAMNDDLTQGQKNEEYGASAGGMAGGAAGAAAGGALGLMFGPGAVIASPLLAAIMGIGGALGGNKAGRAIMKDDGTTTPSATDKDVAETLGVTPDTVKLLERMSGIGGGMERVASAFERIDKLERFSTNVNAIQKGLDINELSKYNRNMQEIAKSLEDMNKALAEDNKGLFGGTGVASADVVKGMGGSGSSAELINSINSNMSDMNIHLKAIRATNKTIAGNS